MVTQRCPQDERQQPSYRGVEDLVSALGCCAAPRARKHGARRASQRHSWRNALTHMRLSASALYRLACLWALYPARPPPHIHSSRAVAACSLRRLRVHA